MKNYEKVEEVSHDLTKNPIIQNRQIGRFMIRSYFLGHSQPIFEKVLIVRCEHLMAYDVYEYYAYSEAFRPVKLGELIPEYHPNIFQNTDDPTATFVTFEEVL